jgi:hypothetical protein
VATLLKFIEGNLVNKRAVIIGLLIGGCAAGYWWMHSKSALNIPVTQHIDIPPDLSKPKIADAVVYQPSKSDHKSTEDKSYKALFNHSKNYWQLAHELLAAAKAGEPDAQYYLWKAINFCAENNQDYLEQDGKALTLKEALQESNNLTPTQGYVKSVFERCHEFHEKDASDVGSASDWLARATAAGQPAAQAVTAQKFMLQETMQGYAKAGAAPIPITSGPQIDKETNPGELMRAAAQSLDPDALYAIGWAQSYGNQGTNEEKQVNILAWTYMACQRGLDCSPNADWIVRFCKTCDAPTPDLMMETLSGSNWYAVQQRAQDINAKLEAGQWGDLGFGQDRVPDSGVRAGR